jgi:hypothetical protein
VLFSRQGLSRSAGSEWYGEFLFHYFLLLVARVVLHEKAVFGESAAPPGGCKRSSRSQSLACTPKVGGQFVRH